jgi:RNA polymerase sigma-70 factor, ECF subfamily
LYLSNHVALHAAVRITDPDLADNGEELLLARCRMGDAVALRTLYDRHARIVMANARRLGLAAHEVEDVAQEVFTTTFRSLDQIEPGALSSWLFRLTSNRVHDRFRRRRIRETFARWFGSTEPQESPDRPDRIALRRDAERHVSRILSRMTQKKRDVFALFELQGLSGDEIAEQLAIPVDTVWTRLHHARIEFAKVARSLELLEDARTGGAPR